MQISHAQCQMVTGWDSFTRIILNLKNSDVRNTFNLSVTAPLNTAFIKLYFIILKKKHLYISIKALFNLFIKVML